MLAPRSTFEGIFNCPLIPPLKQVPHFGSFCLKFRKKNTTTPIVVVPSSYNHIKENVSKYKKIKILEKEITIIKVIE